MTLEDKLKALKFDHTDMVDGYNTLCDKDITSIINLVDKEIIGEDELHSNGKKLVNPWSCDDCGQDEPGYVRNELRAKMREKLHAKTL